MRFIGRPAGMMVGTAGGSEPENSLAGPGEAGLEFQIHAEDVVLDPGFQGLVEFGQHFDAKTLLPHPGFEPGKQILEMLVGLKIFTVHRAAVALHTLLLVTKMGVRIILDKIEEPDDGGKVFGGGVGLQQQALKLVEVVDQLAMLPVNDGRSGRKLFGPNQHDRVVLVVKVAVFRFTGTKPVCQRWQT